MEKLKQQVQRLGLGERVRLPGRVSPVHDVYAASDVFTMPSFHEGLCNACLEASFAALPPAVLTTCGNAEIVVDGETGLLFRAGDVDDLASKLGAVVRDREASRRIGAAGRSALLDHDWTWSGNADRVLEIYESLRARRRP